MQVIGIGTDIIRVDRLTAMLERQGSRGMSKLFTPSEIEYCSKYSDRDTRLAGRFAAKEAVSKALGTGMTQGVSFISISIESGENYKPHVVLTGKTLEIAQRMGIQSVQISISHESEYAVAFAVALG